MFSKVITNILRSNTKFFLAAIKLFSLAFFRRNEKLTSFYFKRTSLKECFILISTHEIHGILLKRRKTFFCSLYWVVPAASLSLVQSVLMFLQFASNSWLTERVSKIIWVNFESFFWSICFWAVASIYRIWMHFFGFSACWTFPELACLDLPNEQRQWAQVCCGPPVFFCNVKTCISCSDFQELPLLLLFFFCRRNVSPIVRLNCSFQFFFDFVRGEKYDETYEWAYFCEKPIKAALS